METEGDEDKPLPPGWKRISLDLSPEKYEQWMRLAVEELVARSEIFRKAMNQYEELSKIRKIGKRKRRKVRILVECGDETWELVPTKDRF